MEARRKYLEKEKQASEPKEDEMNGVNPFFRTRS